MNLRFVTLALLALSAPLGLAAPAYNVLFIAVDDLRPSLGCYGEKQIHSPNIDALARDGFRFNRAYCQVGVCNPSRNSVLSGCRPDTIHIYDNRVFLRPTNPDILTLPEHFKQQGYHTASVGKVFHHSLTEPGDDPQSWSEPSWYHGNPHRHWFAAGTLAELDRLKKLPEGKRPRVIRGPPYEASDQPDEVYPDAQTATQAIATLRRLKGERFFLGVGFVKPHLPFTCPQKYWDLYPAETIHLPADYDAPRDVPADARHDLYELRSYAIDLRPDPKREDALNLIRAYRACTSFMDAQVGRVLTELDALGLRDNTVVVLWGDHGYHLGENRLWTKMTNFEICTRVPLIVRVPGQANAGRSTDALVELIDLYPSLAELCGLPRPAHLEGTSFVPLLADPARPWKKAVFSQYARSYNAKRDGEKVPMGYSIRTATHRYTEWFDPAKRLIGTELYDQAADPGDTHNLASAPEQRAVAAALAAQLHAGWRAALPPAETGSKSR